MNLEKLDEMAELTALHLVPVAQLTTSACALFELFLPSLLFSSVLLSVCY